MVSHTSDFQLPGSCLILFFLPPNEKAERERGKKKKLFECFL